MTDHTPITLDKNFFALLESKIKAAASIPWRAHGDAKIVSGENVVANIFDTDDRELILAACNALPLLVKRIQMLEILLEAAHRESDLLGSACDKIRINARNNLAMLSQLNHEAYAEIFRINREQIATNQTAEPA